MRSRIFALVLGLLAMPAALYAAPPQHRAKPHAAGRLAQNTVRNSTGSTTGAPDQSINGRPLLDAPVPGGPQPGISPVDRAAGPGSRDLTAGPVNSTPFSAAPTSAQQAGSPASPNGTPGGIAIPSLGR